MKRIAAVACALGFVLAGLTGTSVSAEVGTAAINCNHWSGGGILPISARYVEETGGPSHEQVGAVQLCRNGSDYWGYIVFYKPMINSFWGQAGLYRIRNNVIVERVNCDTPPLGPPRGGNGYVEPGQTQCWTKKIRSVDPVDKFYVLGIECFPSHPSCEFIWARGETAVTR